MKKYAQIANFNVVFGKDEKPMLTYFDSIIFPAFTSGITKISDMNEFLLTNIEVVRNQKGECILMGQFVKKTILEIKSDINAQGKLIEKDEQYSTAPYSSFAINLLNHRMIFIPNQKGSPSLANFRSAIKYIIKEFIKQQNKLLEEDKKLEFALINIVGIPSMSTLREILENVEKINKLTLRFYPLNGDLDFEGVFGTITKEMREIVGSKNGEIVFKSPKSLAGVQEIIAEAAGTIDPVLQVTTKENSKATLRDNELSEKYEVDFKAEMELGNEKELIIEQMSKIKNLNYTNEMHESIYKENEEKILPFITK